MPALGSFVCCLGCQKDQGPEETTKSLDHRNFLEGIGKPTGETVHEDGPKSLSSEILGVSGKVYEFVWAATTEYHRLGGLSNRNVFSHSSGGWRSKIKGSAGLISSEAPLSLHVVPPFLCVLMWSLLHACVFLVFLSFFVQIPLLIRTPVSLIEGLLQRPRFNLTF